ncbi:MAG: CBS domain-containing protein [Bacillota bacterium]|nr:CBS domain-containing protein [Bacillota bacterium]
MKIIIGHPNLDFDALASMVAAKKLYPDATLVTVGKLDNNVQDFVNLHKEIVKIQNYKNKRDVDTLIMVDTRSKKRLQEYAAVLENEGIKVIIYDHHLPGSDEIDGAEIHYEALGANVTQLIEMIRELDIPLDPLEATVMALGIYEDTGSLAYDSTTYRDLEAAAWLLRQGANLSVVANYIDRAFSPEQQELLNDLMAGCRIKTIKDKKILFARAATDDFVGELALLTGKLRDFHIVDAVFSIVRMGKRIYIVARSSDENINVREILKAYNGAGHDHAASATIKAGAEDISLAAVQVNIEAALERDIPSPLTVGDIMTSPVKTISSDTTINQVGEYLVRYGHSGYPVVQEGKVIGIISRRDVEKAKYHGFGKVPVKGYMSHHVVTLSEDMPVKEAQALMLKENVGRLPVMRGEELVGIVSRTDMLQLLYGKPVTIGHRTVYQPAAISVDHHDMLKKLRNSLPEATYQILREISFLADREGYRAYLVGGLVRDMLLETSSSDLDIVVEGDGIEFAKLVAKTYDGHLSAYERFGTANVVIDGYLKLDIATARTEFYEYPAAMPQVEISTLKQDLYRRDFTINAMAISLNYSTIGTFIDYYNGRADLESRQIRVLHNLSFVEDPTRIMRALRFAVRYEFTLEEETKEFALKAVEDGVFDSLSYRRIWQEVRISLREDRPYEILLMFHEYGLWPYILPGHDFDYSLGEISQLLEGNIGFMKYFSRKPNIPLVYFLLLVYDFTKEELDEFFEKIDGRRHYKNSAYMVLQIKNYIYEDIHDRTAVDWYYFLAELSPEVMITFFLKADAELRSILGQVVGNYLCNKINLQRKELRGLEGFERGMAKAVWDDLIEEKSQGKLTTPEEELAYVKENLLNGKYKNSAEE